MHCPQSDGRSGRVVFVCHCLLNANAKVCGLSQYSHTMPGLVEVLAESGLGIIQLPCPEFLHLGPKRWWQMRSQYDTPAYRALCRRLADEAADLARQYLDAGCTVAGLLGVEGSPSCGVTETYDAPDWGGRPREVELSECRVKGSGIYMATFRDVFAERSLDIPFVGVPSGAGDLRGLLALVLENGAS